MIRAVRDWREDRVGAALRGENPFVMARMRSGFACIGDMQLLPGYSVLLPDDPAVTQLSDLDLAGQARFLFDMALLGRAVETVCRDNGLRRMNFEIQGNTLPLLHAHVRPRYAWEDAERQAWPVSSYPLDVLSSEAHDYDDAAHGPLRAAITAELERLMREADASSDTIAR
jgi:diadenosine tetraphosphate (Ap4A) HIT family hydrolase